MNVIDVENVTYHHGRIAALKDVSFTVPQGALYALLGPNGSGKTTLLQCLMGLRTPKTGSARVLGVDSRRIDTAMRTRIGYVAEGQSLPRGMRLRDVESYLAPLYAGRWDMRLANSLRDRFTLDASRRIKHMSRGEQMKASMLCALAPRPEVLVMDEPFTGMDALVKDELISGLLDSANSEGTTVFLCSHDIGELELLADHIGFLDLGVMRVSESMDTARDRFRHVEAIFAPSATPQARSLPAGWMLLQSSGDRLSFVVSDATDSVEQDVRKQLQHVVHVEARGATLREMFVAMAQRSRTRTDAVSKREIAA